MTAQLSTVSWWLCGVDKRQAFSSERLVESFFSTLLFIFIKLVLEALVSLSDMSM